MDEIRNGKKFSFIEKGSRLRRLPRGRNCITDIWYTNFVYIVDNIRSNDQFLLFTSENGEQYNWWININTENIGYNSSGSLNNSVEEDSMKSFDFTFHD